MGSTAALEAYLRVFARLWELLGKGDALPYFTGDAAKDSRIGELHDILAWTRAWMEWNERADLGPGEHARASYGLSHQLFYDIQSCIEGTVGLLCDLEKRWCHHGGVLLLLRKINQDSLESFFGAVRQALGGARDVSIKSVLDATRVVQLRRQDRQKMLANKRKRNAGGRSERVVNAARKKQRAAVIKAVGQGAEPAAAAAAAATSTPSGALPLPLRASSAAAPAQPGPSTASVAPAVAMGSASQMPIPDWRKEHEIHLPSTFAHDHKAAVAAGKAGAARPPHSIVWQQLREAVAEDEKEFKRTAGASRRIKWLTTAAHINKTGFSRMKVGLATDVCSMKTANQLRKRRHGGWKRKAFSAAVRQLVDPNAK